MQPQATKPLPGESAGGSWIWYNAIAFVTVLTVGFLLALL